jgi:hypothetical protein
MRLYLIRFNVVVWLRVCYSLLRREGMVTMVVLLGEGSHNGVGS